MNEKIRMRRVRFPRRKVIPPCEGKKLIVNSNTVVSYQSLGWYLDPPMRIENIPALLRKGRVTNETPFEVYDILQHTRLDQIRDSLSDNPKTLFLEQEQILVIVKNYRQLLCAKNRSNLFLLKVGEQNVFLCLDWNEKETKLLHSVEYLLHQETFHYPSYQFRVFIPKQ